MFDRRWRDDVVERLRVADLRSPRRHRRPESGAEPVELTIFGAASLKGVLDEAATAYAAENPGTTVTVSTDSSAALETQIEQGAPADVFLSADTTNPQKLVDGGFASGDAVDFAGNELTVIVPLGNPAAISSPRDLARAGLKIIAAGDEVPITKYATQLVANLAALDGYPAGFEAAYATNVVSKEDNVKSIVGKIELGEGDAGIVYVTDAAASVKVDPVEVPDEANVPATYAGVVVKDVAEPGGSGCVPRLVRRRRRARDPVAVRLPASAFMTGAVGRRTAPSGQLASRSTQRKPIGWGNAALVVLAGIFAIFLALPIVTLDRPLDPQRLARLDCRIVCPGHRSRAQPGDDRRQPHADGRLRPAPRHRPGPALVPGQVAGRGDRRPADRAAAGRRRPGTVARPRPARCAGRPDGGGRDRHRVHDDRRDPRPDIRVRAVLRPLGARRDRGRRPRPRGRGEGRWRLGGAALPLGHRAARGCRPRGRPGHELGAGPG